MLDSPIARLRLLALVALTVVFAASVPSALAVVHQISVASDSASGPTLTYLDAYGYMWTGQGVANPSWTPRAHPATQVLLASDPSRGQILGYVDKSGNLYARRGLDGSWALQAKSVNQAVLATDATNGAILGYVDANGRLYAKQGLDGAWVLEAKSVTQAVVATDAGNGPILGYVDTSGRFYAKQAQGGPWILEANDASHASLATDPTTGPVLGYVNSNGEFFAKLGLYGGWVLEANPVRTAVVASDPSDGPILGAAYPDGRFVVKQGLSDGWTLEAQSVKQIAIAGNGLHDGQTLGYIGQDGNFYAKQGFGGDWVLEANSGTEGCIPARDDVRGHPYQDGMYEDPPDGQIAGGVEAKIENYVPYVYPWTNYRYTDASSEWVMLASTTSPRFVQFGWSQNQFGDRNTFIEAGTNNSGPQIYFPPYPIDSVVTYKIVFRRGANPNYLFYANGSFIDSLYDPRLTPDQVQIDGEIATPASQMPGGVSDNDSVNSGRIYYPAGKSGSWHPLAARRQTPPSFAGISPSAGTNGSYFNIWDHACSS